MAYQKTNWQTGDIVSSERMNKIQDGIFNSGSIEIIPATLNSSNKLVLSKTWQQMYDLASQNKILIIKTETHIGPLPVTQDLFQYYFVTRVEYINATRQEGNIQYVIHAVFGLYNGYLSSKGFKTSAATEYPVEV